MAFLRLLQADAGSILYLNCYVVSGVQGASGHRRKAFEFAEIRAGIRVMPRFGL